MKESSPPVSAMATPTNSSGNVVDEFEEAFQHCLNVLTKEEALPTGDKDELRMEVEQTTLRFVDLARQMEAFFLQKRFLLSALKPEMVVKEDINELRIELARKDELLKRHYEKINVWQNLLMDLQGYAKSPAQGAPTGTTVPTGAPSGLLASTGMPGMSPVQISGGIVPNVNNNPMSGGSMTMQQQIQQQLQQQQQMQLQQQQLQQQQQMQQMQVPAGMSGIGSSVGGVMVPSQQMFMQQQGITGPRAPPFGAQQGGAGVGGVLQGPLAYLEKTTSNIDLVAGMTDGRR